MAFNVSPVQQGAKAFWRLTLLAASMAAGLAACGGDSAPNPDPSGPPEIRSVVSFGDSLSDVGTYSAITGSGGGKFTINPGPIWVENIAAELGLAITPNIIGYGDDPATWQICPQPACTGYAQGGARITDPDGTGKEEGALTLPLSRQITNHLAASGGRFQGDELVLVLGGNNDALKQIGAYGEIALTQGPAQAKAVTDAAMATAATELVTYLKNEVLGKGARQVTVVNLPPLSQTPLGQNVVNAGGRAVMDSLVNTFNATLEQGINDNRLDVLFYDANAAFNRISANPAEFGIANTQDPACDPVKIALATNGQELEGSALFCNESTLVDAARGGARFQFADQVHPTPTTHKIFSDMVIEALSQRGWIKPAAR
jgi:phospholipase/lecithinase/hemolysin